MGVVLASRPGLSVAKNPADIGGVTAIDLETLLTRAVRIATGTPDAYPRPGQLDLALDIESAFRFSAPMLGIAPTGTGKSFAHLCAAALRWHERGDRTVVSTESLALQSQFVDKDLPVVAQALSELGGKDLRFALLKGVTNYVDPLQLAATCSELSVGATTKASSVAEKLRNGAIQPPAGIQPASLASLLDWCHEAAHSESVSGDRADFDGVASDAMWQLVSSDTASVGPSPLERAREAAASAAIVVTNHAMLGIQATGTARVVHGSKRLGPFKNVIVDEGHALPAAVRSQGSTRISGGQFRGLFKAMSKVAPLHWLQDDTEALAEDLNYAIGRFLEDRKDRGISEGSSPLTDTLTVRCRDYLAAGKRAMGDEQPVDPSGKIARQRAMNRIDRLSAALNSISADYAGNAVWAERDDMGVSVRVSPVGVGGSIKTNLLSDDMGSPLGAAIVSATLPHGFGFEVGVKEKMVTYESPFGQAYDGSAAFVPLSEDLDEDGLTSSRYGRSKFDTELHPAWCIPRIVKLVETNGGSALVLSATKRAGLQYVAALQRALPSITVHSQWHAGSTRQAVQQWKDDVGSVLVGTRSLMTGVDAPGETNTLVIVDRVPRAAKNYIDDARVAILVEQGVGKWDADSRVYAADAALLLEQALGRLIRGVSDRGLVVALDPRLNPASDGSYRGISRRIYAEPFMKFGERFGNLDDVLEWLEARRSPAAQAIKT